MRHGEIDSLKVSIPQWFDKKVQSYVRGKVIAEFQFHNGSIKRKTASRQWQRRWKFQFHNGSIKSRRVYKEPLDVRFQFHNGSIKSIPSLTVPNIQVSFQFHNGSIKRPTTRDILCAVHAFQFHNGSIKSHPKFKMAG